ncbi:hypothetical protein M6B38_222615 [Iris pallida]|uniref:Uncharacterized protein n=1 Tax=Iris pallida TaxID=29817 RepID=A0AAX6DX28_IRIPA|nr:hypothetical protein M6B38_222615 [Iris pallida]
MKFWVECSESSYDLSLCSCLEHVRGNVTVGLGSLWTRRGTVSDSLSIALHRIVLSYVCRVVFDFGTQY